MTLVNVSLKLWTLDIDYMLIFLLKKCEKLLTFFSAKIPVNTRTVNILTTNELVKLTIL